jgi:hypothetical protein
MERSPWSLLRSTHAEMPCHGTIFRNVECRFNVLALHVQSFRRSRCPSWNLLVTSQCAMQVLILNPAH